MQVGCLAAEAVQGPALPLQSIHHVKGGDGLAPGVLCVGDRIPDDILQEHLQTCQNFELVPCHAIWIVMEWCADHGQGSQLEATEN